jgi:transcriptional regulator with XRE-family HTH domain
MHLGEKVRILRAINQISQEELADKIGRTKALISQIENTGKGSYYTIEAIAKAFHMTVDQLKNFESKPQKILKEYEILSTTYEANVRELEKKIESLSNENQLLRQTLEAHRSLIKEMKGKKK